MNKLSIKRYGGIDLLKHFLAICVIVQHMTSKSRYSDETNFFLSNIVQYVNGAVIGFMMISGFFFKPAQNLKGDLVKIIRRTMIPFFIFSLVYAILMVLIGKRSLISGLINTVNLRGASMQLYYLSFLCIVYIFYLLIFNIVLSTKMNIKYVLVLLLFAFLIISLINPTDSPTGSDYKLLPIYFLSFGIAVFLSILRKENEKKYLFIAILIIVTGILIGIYDYRFYHVAAMIALLVISYFISNNLSFLNRQFPGSGGVYLFHTPILNFLISIFLVKLGIIETENLLLSIIFTYIVALTISLLIIKILPKYRFLILE